jgi:hypothetical protein
MILRAEEVRAVLDGEKTVLRRQVKPQPDVDKRKHRWGMSLVNGVLSWGKAPWRVSDPYNHYAEQSVRCPFGVPGDRLWVRETWHWCRDCASVYGCETCTKGFVYRATTSDGESRKYSWKPSVHMRRWACRLVLEVTNVRVERLQDITEADARAEGLEPVPAHGAWVTSPRHEGGHWSARKAFADKWIAIYGEDSWEANPWVWRVAFRRVDQ